ncbi:hypothetical protein [Mucilaginibacter psychrotolerans]|uniref:Uncharacterized protein n=1 Tax=Mucilaginibacter psychrotolerans TaxID=1524096 RepID=A0A4Y8RXB8_9SPHI|nr:hypothetical protein [Mucilaginibacter psychrotolerans]TFF30372.1 hypothetical protein E2R66_27600 [Mucilaginibacter psychrotolerans]
MLVPLNEWDRIAAKHEDVRVLIQEPAQPKSKRKPSEFRGVLNKEVAKQMILDIEKDREEWERRF